MWETVGANVAKGTYTGYPRLVGETGGKDFILAHPSADAEAVATAVVRGSFEYRGRSAPLPPGCTSRRTCGPR